MKVDFNIDIHHLPRVEGHGDIRISVRDGKLAEAKWAVVETPRFFEMMVKGMSAERTPFLTSRICGICSISHTLASIRSLERAMQITPPETARIIRLLAMHGETLQSHALHLFFLAAPDFMGTPSVVPLLQSHPEVVEAGLMLKELGNELSIATCGRATHPVSLVLGGVSKTPSKQRLAEIRQMIADRRPMLDRATEFFMTLTIPDFVRETEFISLRDGESYPFIGGNLVSTDGVVRDENDYLLMTNEYTVDFSTSKFTKVSRESSAAGALARFNNNYDQLHPRAKEAAAAFGLQPVCHNPFMNNIAQLVECHHIVASAEAIIDQLLDDDLNDFRIGYEPKAGAATGAVEAPRGVLYHYMETSDEGKVVKADCIIPTTQNNANIHHDLHALAEQALAQGKGEKEVEKLCEMLVRSYDPCISCSVH
ncbi:Ni/Fe hydrogenase subunit alpha [Chlorobaculum thiosulfatiphilum]|uniref:Ni/Fe hydrogenase subunit alpha n=1 Tax=Chlorobaculum thiosulfatiphilum TaxID=115852 RepID=A0A5C4S5H0_CHLTI|nr:Ni/Fe hydrogenase subunit alpha [Chlorobaculum thiosulfatiphilum]TNJ38512.1 Ni/Fe hydrogenase subunit alpha [Chlorobaculum thiosulfatiphilum]